jgi:hypothetical protein
VRFPGTDLLDRGKLPIQHNLMESKPSDKLGRYQLLSPIDEGGMGEAWKAHATQLDRHVAFKATAMEARLL